MTSYSCVEVVLWRTCLWEMDIATWRECPIQNIGMHPNNVPLCKVILIPTFSIQSASVQSLNAVVFVLIVLWKCSSNDTKCCKWLCTIPLWAASMFGPIHSLDVNVRVQFQLKSYQNSKLYIPEWHITPQILQSCNAISPDVPKCGFHSPWATELWPNGFLCQTL